MINTRMTILAKWFFIDEERFKSKLKEYNIESDDTELLQAIEKEKNRINSLKKEDLSINKTKEYSEGEFLKKHTKYLCGAPYWSEEVVENNKRTKKKQIPIKQNNPKRSEKKFLILVDADNQIGTAIGGYDNLKNRNNYKIDFYLSDDNNIPKVLEERNIEPSWVKSGDQAVDNRIKSILGKVAKERCYKKIYIISHDKGYDKYIKKNKNTFNTEVCRIKSFKEIK